MNPRVLEQATESRHWLSNPSVWPFVWNVLSLVEHDFQVKIRWPMACLNIGRAVGWNTTSRDSTRKFFFHSFWRGWLQVFSGWCNTQWTSKEHLVLKEVFIRLSPLCALPSDQMRASMFPFYAVFWSIRPGLRQYYNIRVPIELSNADIFRQELASINKQGSPMMNGVETAKSIELGALRANHNQEVADASTPWSE